MNSRISIVRLRSGDTDFQFLVRDQDVFVGADLVSPDDLLRGDDLFLLRAEHPSSEGGIVLAVEQAEGDAAGLDGLDQPHGNRHQAEADRPAPDALSGCFILPVGGQCRRKPDGSLFFIYATFFRLASRA